MSGKQHTTCLVRTIAIAACMAFCLLSVTLSAQVVFAGSGSSGSYDFNAAGTWIGGVPPAANDNVEIEVNTGIDVTIYDFPSSSFNSLQLKGDGILHIHTDDDALITLGSGILGDANAFKVESNLDVYIDGLNGSIWLLVVATSGFNEAQIEGKIYLRPGTDGEIIQLISQQDPSLDNPIWNFKSGSLIEIGNAGNNFYKDDYPFSNSGLTPDLGLETHVFQNGSKLVQRDGLDPFGVYIAGWKCRFESGSTFEFADNNWVSPSTIHKPNFENRTYGNFIFSSTKDLSFDGTMLADAVCNIENLTIVSNKLSFQQRRLLTLNISGNITLPNGTVSNTYLEFNPPAIVTGPPLLPGGRIIVNITNPGTPAASFSGGSNILFANRDADINFQAFSVTNCAVHIQIEASPSTDGRLTVETDARLNMIGEHYIHGTGQFNMQAGTVLGIGSAAGITASANAGNVRTANRIYSVNGENTFVYQGNLSPQSTGNGLSSWPSGSAGQTIIIDKDNSTDEVELTNTVHRVYKLEVNKGRFKLKSNDIFTVSDKPGSQGDLIVTTDGRFETATNTTVVFQGSVLVTAATAIDFVNVDIITGTLVGVNFGGGAVRPTVHNQLRMITSASISTNPPIYATGSTLIYRRDGGYSVGAEWTSGSSSAATPGVPHHVQIGQVGQNDTRITITGDRQCLGNLVVGDPGGGSGYRLLSSSNLDVLRIGGNLVRCASSTQANSFANNSLVVFNGTSEQLITDLSVAPNPRGMALPRVEINNPAGVKLNSSALTVVIMSGSTGNVFRMLNGNLDLNGGYVTMITNNGTLIAEGGVRRITNTHATQQGQFTINADGKVFSAASGGSWVFDRGPSKGVTLISRNGAFNFGLVSGSPIVTINDSLVILHGSGFTNSPFYGSQSTLVYANPGGRNTGTLTEWQPVPGTPVGAGQPVNVQLGLGFGYPHLSGFNLALEGATTSGTPTLTLTNNTIRRVSGNITLGHATGGGTHTLALGTGSPSTTVLQVGGNWLRYSNSSLTHLNRPVTFDGSTDQTITAFGGGTQAFGIVDINKTGGELQLVAGTTIDLQATTASATPSLPALLNMRAGNLNLNGGTCTLSGSLAVGVQVTGTRSITSTATGGQFNFNTGATPRTVLPSASPGNTLTFGTNVLVNLNTGVNFGSSTTTVQGELRLNSGGSVSTNPPIYAANSILSYNVGGAVTTGTEWSPNVVSGPGVPHHVHIGKGAGTFTTTVSSPTAGGFRYLNGDLVIGNGTTAYTLQIETTNTPELRIGGNWLRNTNGTFTHNDRLVTFNGTGNQTITVAGGGTETFGLLQVNKTAGELRLSSSPATNVSVAATAGTALLQMNNVGALNLQGQTLNFAGTAANSGIALTGSGLRSILSSPGTGFVNFSSAAANREITSSGGGTLTFGSGVVVNLNTSVNFGTSISTIQGQLRMNSGGSVNANPPFYDNNSYLIYNTTGTASPATEWLAVSESTSAFGVPHHVQVGLTAGGNNSKAEITTDYRFLKGDMIIGDGSSGTGYELIMSGSGVLRVGGNWTKNNNGTFTRGTREVVFRSGTNATITASAGETFHNLTIDKAAAANTVTLNNVVEVANILNLNEGRVITDLTNYLQVTNPALTAITGGDATSYVQGPLRRRANNIAGVANQMRFPVGEFSGGTHYYKPVWLQDVVASNGTSTAYQAAYYRGNPPPNPTSYFFSGFAQGVLAGEYWRFESINATPTDGILVLDYNSSANFMDIFKSPFNPSDPSTHEIGIYRKFNTNPSNVTYQPTNISGVLSYFTTPQQVTRHTNYMQLATAPGMNFNNHQFFTLAWVKENILILPIQLLSFEASLQQGNSSLLTWQIADDKDLQQFEVEVSRDGQRYTKLASVGRNGTQYTYRHTGLQSGVYYYRLHILGKDGSRAYSKVQMVQVGVNVTVIQGLLQNPVQGGRALVKVYSATPQDAFATVVDHSGRVLLRQKIALTKGNNLAPLSVLPLMPGMYRLQLQTADGVQQTMPFVK